MSEERCDGSAGDANYGRIGAGYRDYRRPEPEFESAIRRALGDAKSVLNLGAGAGSYEPTDREVTAVEPSATMRSQRPAHLNSAIAASAESLPFDDGSFDAAMTTFSVHQWGDLEAGLAEMRRVSRGPVVIMTCDPTLLDRSWLAEYAPEMIATEARRYPRIDRIRDCLAGDVEVRPLPIPLHCTDGFSEAYFGRPEMLLDPGARKANSAWSFLDEAAVQRFVARLEGDLASGEWDRTYGALRDRAHFEGSLVLITARP
ncbi:class I SAM-dependent methyltransferase [Brevibacterium sp. GP-SGM9]|uniref:class I SAM-dependent methyltransferase n=1 Tax=Brevibacterium sp. GP-SGM9 TaxID=3376990 RepID=UPI0039A54F24